MQLEGTHRSGFSFPKACQNKRLCFFQRGDGVLPADSGVLLQEFIQSFSAFEVVQQCLERDARAAEYWFPAVDFRILDNDAIRDTGSKSPRRLGETPVSSDRRASKSTGCSERKP